MMSSKSLIAPPPSTFFTKPRKKIYPPSKEKLYIFFWTVGRFSEEKNIRFGDWNKELFENAPRYMIIRSSLKFWANIQTDW